MFYASIKASFALVAYIVYGLFFLLAALIIGSPYFYLAVVAIPLFGLFSLYYWEFKQDGQQQATIAKLDPSIITQLLQERTDILNRFTEK